MPERDCHAFALDGGKRQVDSMSSNIGHTAVVRTGGSPPGRGNRRAPARRAALLGLGRPHAWRARGRLQPARLPHRNSLATRELSDRCRPGSVRSPRRGHQDRVLDPVSGTALRAPPPRGVCWLSRNTHNGSRCVPERVEAASVGCRRSIDAAHDTARSRAGRDRRRRRRGGTDRTYRLAPPGAEFLAQLTSRCLIPRLPLARGKATGELGAAGTGGLSSAPVAAVAAVAVRGGGGPRRRVI